MIIGHQLKIPIIGVSSSELYPWGHEMIANPRNLAFVPFELLPMTPPLSYWERMKNFLLYWWSYHEFNYYTRVQDDMIRKNFGEDAPGVRELERSVSMILANSHSSVNGAKPVTAGLIEVGGLHVRDDGPELPENLQKWLDESAHGFIYFTFGSMVRIETLPKETLAILYRSFGKIAPVRVLMKIAKPQELPDGLPGNVITQAWIQQLKVLKHKNIRAFITHGGLMGTQEAIHCGVPMIGVPLFADQFVNIHNYVEKKIALFLDYKAITEEKLDAAIDAILNDPVYLKSVRAISEKFRDRPLTPAETAVYWVEYIIKHGSQALRSPALDLTWWQEALLDVYVALVLALLVTVYAIIMIVGALVRLIFGKKRGSKRASRSKKNK
ncbi:UDP-glucuronosyltransferase 2C1 isoform X2 [Cephus cinctus]|nr:UDP-glucuronosyltransferase 2C1 isoform X2 [Cephus cinctus]XP_024945556.1 UDP-glucuronosyltransferase 2C1 isoform X2 [Cephus cinctus]